MWHNVLERNKFILSLYQEVPKLVNVQIVSIKITDEGSRVSINFNMPKFADNVPLKWHNSGYNTVFVELDFFDVQELDMNYCKKKLKGTINIEKNEQDKFKVDISGSVNMNLVSDIGMVQSVSGYIDNLKV